MTEGSDEVLQSLEGSVATITINRPEQRNALGRQTLEQLRAAFATARANAEVRVVVLTGAGDKAFCAGADLAGFAAGESQIARHQGSGLFVDLFLEMQHLGKPIIGGLNGHALAGGFGLALCCDLLVCADSATFGTPEIRVGVWPMMIMSIVIRNLGRKRAMELFLTGERIDAATALQWGFVNRVVPAAEVRSVTAAWAAELGRWSPLIMRLGRDAFYDIDGLGFEPALRHLQSELTVASSSDDFHEGVSAFLQKREPNFTGR